MNRGKGQLAGPHMIDGPTQRWYTKCGGMPLFNAYENGRIPDVARSSHIAKKLHERLWTSLWAKLFLRETTGYIFSLKPLTMGRLMRRFFRRRVKDILSGDRRHNPLPDPKTLEPIASPRHLTGAE